MARTKRHGNARDGQHYAPGSRNIVRGYRHKIALLAHGESVRRDWDDEVASRRDNNRARRAADRAAVRAGLAEYYDVAPAAAGVPDAAALVGCWCSHHDAFEDWIHREYYDWNYDQYAGEYYEDDPALFDF